MDVLLAELPVRAVKDELTWARIRQQEQHQPCDIGRAQWMLVEKAFQAANHRIGLSIAWKPRRESGVAHVLGLEERKDDESEEFDLIFPVLRKVRREATRQSLQSGRGRALLSRVRQDFSSLQKLVGTEFNSC